MAPRKLSDSDKAEMIELYKQPNHTTSTLAGQYGVSNSTVSRILKMTLPAEEYSQLISQKRLAGADRSESAASKRAAKRSLSQKKVVVQTAQKQATGDPEQPAVGGEVAASKTTVETAETSPVTAPQPKTLRKRTPDESATPARVEPPKLKTETQKEVQKSEQPVGTSRRRRRSRRKSEDDDEQQLLLATDMAETAVTTEVAAPVISSDDDTTAEDEDEDDLTGLDETLGDDFGDDDLDDEEDDEEDDAETIDLPKPKLQPTAALSIMPLGEAVLPKPCYLVVDMRSELITRPLSDFADLGQIPSSEEKANTLPVFDNHRVARRFSRNKQRVIKVPDGNLIGRTSLYLKAKGITRLLVDGQVFDIVGHE